MKIVFDLTGLYNHISGIEKYAMEITKHMIKNCGWHEYVLLFKYQVHNDYAEFVKQKNVSFKILKWNNRLVFSQITLLRALNKIKADAYVFLAFPAPILFGKKNQYVAVHDMSPWDCGENMKKISRMYFKMSFKHAFKKARKIITVSKFSARRIHDIAGVPKSKIWLIYDGVEEALPSQNDMKQKYGIPSEYILSLSTLEPRKNLKLLIEAYAKLIKKHENIPRLVLAGRQGWKMEEAIGQCYDSISENIIFTGFIDEEDIPNLYKNARLFVFPSLYEGFGIPPLEAMNYGVPVISSDAASMPEILKDGPIYFKSGNVKELELVLEKMLTLGESDKDHMTQVGKNIAIEYSWDNEARKLERKLATCGVKVRL